MFGNFRFSFFHVRMQGELDGVFTSILIAHFQDSLHKITDRNLWLIEVPDNSSALLVV